MQEKQAIIERIRRVSSAAQHLELAVEDSFTKLKPGQSLLVRLSGGWDPYLREHWWPVDLVKNKMIVERPASARYEPGQVISLLGPVGQPYRFRRSLRNVLLLAYNNTPTALLMTIPWLLANRVSVTLVLLGEATGYDTQHISPEIEIIRGDENMNWEKRVMTIGWADQVFAVVPQNDEISHFQNLWTLFTELRSDIPRQYLFGVFQPPLPCGTGACQACTLRMAQGMRLVCSDGPAFDLATVMLGV